MVTNTKKTLDTLRIVISKTVITTANAMGIISWLSFITMLLTAADTIGPPAMWMSTFSSNSASPTILFTSSATLSNSTFERLFLHSTEMAVAFKSVDTTLPR